MRILMVSHGYPPILSGVTLVVQKVARAMAARGHAVTVITASDQREAYETEDAGVRLIRLRGLANPFWEDGPIPMIGFRQLEEIAVSTHPEVLHAHEAAVLGLQLVRLRRELGLPTVATCYYVPRFAARYLSWTDEPQEAIESFFWSYSVWIFGQFDRVVFATEAHRRPFLENGLTAPTTIISNGIDAMRYYPGDGHDEGVEARLGLPPRPRILFVSRLAKDKEIDVLIRAMAAIRMHQPAHLLLVGRGDDRERLATLTAELGLEQFVHFLGYVPEEDLPALYRAADLFAIASTCEVQSLPTLQAVATGLPVVAADALALPELVHHGINGRLVPPGNPAAMAGAILEILEDPDRARQLGQAGLAIAERHTEAATFEQYEALYRQVIAQHQTRARHPAAPAPMPGELHLREDPHPDIPPPFVLPPA